MIRAKPWNGQSLKGNWRLTYKIDGVRALWTSEGWMSRANKPLYNIPSPRAVPRYGFYDCEVFLGNFRDTIRAVRTKNPRPGDTPVVLPEHLYSLDPLDRRLEAGEVYSPSADAITEAMKSANRMGYEGLVLRQAGKWLKVKPEETHDVLITGAVEGVGKHKGRLGALQTAKGDVGTGFSDEERECFWAHHLADLSLPIDGAMLVGSTIEVSCMQFTPDGKFRHPRFVRMRPDKVASE